MTESILNRIITDRPEHDGNITVAGLGHRRSMPLAEFHDRARAVAEPCGAEASAKATASASSPPTASNGHCSTWPPS
ncbi:hypothetical protein GCM10029992_25150 [Glycomyces albus]